MAAGVRSTSRLPYGASLLGVGDVGLGRGGVEDDVDVVEAGHGDEPVDALVRWSGPEPARRGPARRSRGRCRPSRPSRGCSERRSTLIIRSVPMLPEPMMATLVFCHRLRPFRRTSRSRCRRPVISARTVTRGDGDHGAERAGEDDLAGAQRVAEVAGGRGQPGSALSGSPRQAAPLPSETSIVVDVHRASSTSAGSNSSSGSGAGRRARTARWRRCRRRCRVMRDVPVRDPAVDDLERGDRVVDRRADLGQVEVGPSVEVGAEHEGDLGLHLRLQQPLDRDLGAASETSMSSKSTPKSGRSTPSCCWTAGEVRPILRPTTRAPAATRVSVSRCWTS